MRREVVLRSAWSWSCSGDDLLWSLACNIEEWGHAINGKWRQNNEMR
jgi:hypothetical protein